MLFTMASTSSSELGNLVNDELVFIKRKRGEVLLHSGHQYHKNKEYKNGSAIWLCRNFAKSKCNGSLTIENKTNIVKTKPHKCVPDFGKNMIDLQMYKLKVASTSFKPVPELYKECVKPLKDQGIDIVNKFPNLKAVKSGVYKFRNKDANIQKIMFKDTTDVKVPPMYDSFILFDYTYEKNKIIGFASAEAKECIKISEHLFGDGTFSSCTKPFYQLYVIHGDLGSSANTANIVPLIYVLMTNKTEKSYYALFSMLKSQIPDMDPSRFTMDYETPAMNAIMKVFPKIEMCGCYYHFSNCIWKKGKNLGIIKNRNLRRIVALSAVLPLLPPDLITEGWNYVENEVPEDDESLNKFKKYMQTQWLKNPEWIKIWSVYGKRHRTNNFAEGWHNKLNNQVGRKNPNLMKLLKCLHEDAEYYAIRINGGIIPDSREKPQIQRDTFIMNCQMMLNDHQISVGHFLEKLRS